MSISQIMGQMAILSMENKLQRENPQMYQMFQNAKKNGSDPVQMFKQITKDYSPEQLQSLFTKAKEYGIPDDVINQVRY